MIRSKQLEELRKLDTNLRSLGKATQPSLEKHVMIALVSGEVPKLKPVAAISQNARKKIVTDRYSRNLAFSEVFASCNGFDNEMKQWSGYEKTRLAAVSRYAKEADKVLLKAMDADADAGDISEQLHDAADRAGLKSLTPPVFEEPTVDD